jgi:ribosomal protein S6--L-glutamate ligase
MRIYFLVVRRVPPVPSPVLLEVYDILRARGYTVDAGIAEEEPQRPDLRVPAHDLYALKSHTELSLSLAGVLHAQGAQIMEPYPCCAATQNKIIASRILRAAGVPTPRTWTMGDPELLAEVAEHDRLIVKPYMGHRGARISIVSDADGLRAAAAANPTDDPLIVQELIPGPGHDLKIYVVGDQVFAVRKTFSERSFTIAGDPVPVDTEVRDAALRVGQALGLGLYGLDMIEAPDGPVVVDVNYFPGYKGVPDAGAMIADYIDNYARRIADGTGPPAGRMAIEGPTVPLPARQ